MPNAFVQNARFSSAMYNSLVCIVTVSPERMSVDLRQGQLFLMTDGGSLCCYSKVVNLMAPTTFIYPRQSSTCKKLDIPLSEKLSVS